MELGALTVLDASFLLVLTLLVLNLAASCGEGPAGGGREPGS
jgi:hypothetical protein